MCRYFSEYLSCTCYCAQWSTIDMYIDLSSAGEQLVILLLYPFKISNLWTSEDYRKPNFC